MTVNTVVIIEAGIGALSLGFAEAGFQIKEAYEKDKKALNIYKNNIGGKICEHSLSELSPENIPDADVIAIDLMEMSGFRQNGQNTSNGHHTAAETLKKVREIINQKRPPIFCLVMQRGIQRSPELSEFVEKISYLRYYTSWRVIGSREATGFPVTEEQLYVIGNRISGDDVVSLEYMDEKDIIPIRKFISNIVEDSWYYRLDRENIQENDSKDSFLCWRRDKYVERPYAEWNLIKMPLVRAEGRIHRLTHREAAKLKGFPEDFVFGLSNKAALYRMLVYSPHVKVVKQIAESLSDSLIQTPLYKMQKADGRKFEEIFGSYLEQKHGTVKRFNEPDEGIDFIYTYKDLTFYFELKIYSSDYAVEQNLHRECRRLIKKEGIGGRRVILAVANLVSDEVKNACKYEYDIFIWDVRNLLWLFEEFPVVKNEFVALLNYSIDAIAPKKPEFYIFEGTEEEPEYPVFEGTEEKSESDELKEKLRKIKPGKEQWQQYEEFCKKMLIYVLGDYLALWQSQEPTRH